MIRFLFFCLMCYFVFLVGSILFPLFIICGIVALILYGLKALFDFFTPSSYHLDKKEYYHYYKIRNPAMRLLLNMWQGFISLLYQLVFTITKAINDGKNSYKK
jgi:hypothetical protein